MSVSVCVHLRVLLAAQSSRRISRLRLMACSQSTPSASKVSFFSSESCSNFCTVALETFSPAFLFHPKEAISTWRITEEVHGNQNPYQIEQRQNKSSSLLIQVSAYASRSVSHVKFTILIYRRVYLHLLKESTCFDNMFLYYCVCSHFFFFFPLLDKHLSSCHSVSLTCSETFGFLDQVAQSGMALR